MESLRKGEKMRNQVITVEDGQGRFSIEAPVLNK